MDTPVISVGKVGVLGVLGTEGVLGVLGAVEELPEEELSEEEGLLPEAELLEDGLLLVEDDEYTISGAGVTAKIILINSLSGSNSITFIVLKNMIGESVINAGEIVQTANGLTDSSIIGIMEAET